MATVGYGSVSGSWIQFKNSSKRDVKNERQKRFNVSCGSSVLTDPYSTLRINRGASEPEVRKAFRQLALQYHPDVCRGSNCGVQFHQINEAYDIVMSNLRGETEEEMKIEAEYYDPDEPLRGMYDSDWEMWEEWMGWEGAGIRDYTSHINPYT